ncbi:hypothetical protein [Alteromonas stellipolaris]|uniref:hypothetical protein n=1 Tax=Alteromonas stellipolaris TaxID=233316 RepID=UPI0030FC828A
MKKLVSRFLALSTLTLLNISAFSASSTEYSSDTVIATWSAKSETEMTLSQAKKLLNESRYPDATGNERQQVTHFIHYQKQKKDTLSATALTELMVLEAKVLQGTHQFSQAAAILNTIDTTNNAAALLLLADINIQQGNPAAAKTHCQQLVGKTSYLLAFTCMLNAEFTLNTSTATYEKLLSLEGFADKAHAEEVSDSERLWYYETLAAMAYSLDKPEATISHLDKLSAQKLPVSALLLWSDAQLKLAQPQRIIDRFKAMQSASNSTSKRTFSLTSNDNGNNAGNSIDDGLLLRWAKAERQISLHGTEIQKQLADRMALRTWREDVSHAAQVASYFLDIDYKPAIALKFARLNWQAAQTRSDARLLARAESAVATSSTLN